MELKLHKPNPITWEPQPDITAYELALCLPMFHTTGHVHHFYNQLPPEAQRHWKANG